MKIIFHLLILACMSCLALAKSTAKTSRRGDTNARPNHDSRLLRKKKKTKKKNKVPKGPKSPSTQIFYSKTPKGPTASFRISGKKGGSSRAGNRLLTYYIDLGVVKGHPIRETISLVEASFTTSISLAFDVYRTRPTTLDAGMIGESSLSILAYSGCDSAASCKAANIVPTPLTPEGIDMVGWKRDVEHELDQVEDFQWRDALISTNEATFLLAGKGSGDFFLQARILLYTDISDDIDARSASVDVMVHDWIVVVEDESRDTSITESNGYTLSPTVSTAPSA